MLGDTGLEVLCAGRVAVIESASETTHYPQLNRGAFTDLDLPWLQLEYVDESELAALLDEPLEDRFAAVVFTPGAMALPGVRALLQQREAILSRALAHGVGFVITATTLGGVDRFDLAFLPEGSRVSLVDTGMREMAGRLVTDSHPDDVILPEEGHRAVSALSLAAGHALGWTHAATLHHPSGQSEVVTWRAQFGLARVIVSVMPYEWVHRTNMVRKALTRATRNRGVLVLGRQASPPWFREVRSGEFVAVLGDLAEAPDLVTDFAHLRLCRDVDWSRAAAFGRSQLLARLENQGTVEFVAPGPGGEVFTRLEGLPRYLTRLRQAQADLIDRVPEMSGSPTFHLLALALLSTACREVVQGRLYIPDLFRRPTVASIVTSAMSRRVCNGNVDGLLLPTVNLLAACTICDVDDSAAVTMAAWVAMYARNGTEDQRAQARWALWAADRQDLLDLIPEPQIKPASVIGQLACQLDDGSLEPVPAGEELAEFSGLDRAVLAYTHARWGDPDSPASVWEVLNIDRHPDSRSGAIPVNAEELCYRTAAQILLDVRMPLAVHPREVPVPQVRSVSTTELLTRQAEAEVSAHEERQAQEALVRVSRAARWMAGVLGALAVVLMLVVGSVPLWLPTASGLGPEVRVTLTVGVLVAVSTLIAVVTSTDTAQAVTPAWLSAVGRAIQRVRD